MQGSTAAIINWEPAIKPHTRADGLTFNTIQHAVPNTPANTISMKAYGTA